MDNQKDLPLEVIRAIKVLWKYGRESFRLPMAIGGFDGVRFRDDYISPIALDMMMLRQEAESG